MDPIKVRHSGYVTLKKIADGHDGSICVAEGLREIPFEIKRVYYINNLENCVSIRGHHAHKKLEQVIFCISGSFVLSLDDGETKQDVNMFRDNVGVVLKPGLWHTMRDFSCNCILLVFASDVFRESDYIRDYDEFLEWRRKQKKRR